jgi:hypothetical protein
MPNTFFIVSSTCEISIFCPWDPPRRTCLSLFLAWALVIQIYQTVKDVDASYDVLLKLFESLGNFIQRFDIHTETLPTMVISRLIVKIIVELLSTLAQVTKYLLKVSEEDEVEATLKKLDIFTQDEARAIGANTEKRQLFANVVTGDRMRQDLQRWLSPPDPSINHNIACDACHDRTATWFIQGDTFTEWKSSGSLLWVCGKRQYSLQFIKPTH